MSHAACAPAQVADVSIHVARSHSLRLRVSLVLTEALQLKKISFLEGVFDGTSAGKDDGFDADVAIATGELGKLIPDLIDALGGEMPLSGAAPAPVAAG